jgi:pimeloyl-ACP methyl ester carboxylesterase
VDTPAAVAPPPFGSLNGTGPQPFFGPGGFAVDDGLAHEDTGTGPALVFLHGITANREHWRPVVELLADRHRCINVDLAGHGASPRDIPVDLFGQVSAVIPLLQGLDLDAPVLVGHSYGGYIATFTATALPVGGVVNVDQRFDVVAFRELLAPLESRLRGDDFEAAYREIVEGGRPDLVPAERQELLWSNLEPRQELLLGVWGAVLDTPPALLMAQVETALPSVSAPYLSVFGSPISDRERSLQELIPDSRVEIWDGLGHLIQLVDPARTADRIAEFVQGLR